MRVKRVRCVFVSDVRPDVLCYLSLTVNEFLQFSLVLQDSGFSLHLADE